MIDSTLSGELLIAGGVAVALVAVVGAVLKVITWARVVVHFFDRAADAAELVGEASTLIIHEMTINGGRMAEPLEDSRAISATVKDLLLDLRASTLRVSSVVTHHDQRMADFVAAQDREAVAAREVAAFRAEELKGWPPR